jgi:hypothetical protein
MGANGQCQSPGPLTPTPKPATCAAGQVQNANGTCTTPTTGVAGASKTVHHTAGATHTVSQPRPAAAVAPATHTSGTLPFTGLQLGVFVLIGVALIGGGLLVRRVGGSRGEA